MLVLSSVIYNLRHLGFGDFEGINPANTHALLMHVEHDLSGGLRVHVEEALKHVDHKLHRRVVVVQQQHLVHAGFFGLGFSLEYRRTTWRARIIRSARGLVWSVRGKNVQRHCVLIRVDDHVCSVWAGWPSLLMGELSFLALETSGIAARPAPIRQYIRLTASGWVQIKVRSQLWDFNAPPALRANDTLGQERRLQMR